jgi:hypothetical protein
MKLTSVLTDVTWLSCRRILDALISGERDRQVLAELSFGTARKKIPALVEALDGTFTDHHAFMCRHYLDQIDHLDTVIAALDARIAKLMGEHDQDIQNLDTIPGIGRRAAEIIIAETGGDTTPWPSLSTSFAWTPWFNGEILDPAGPPTSHAWNSPSPPEARMASRVSCARRRPPRPSTTRLRSLSKYDEDRSSGTP